MTEEETLFRGREVKTKIRESHICPGLISLDCIQIYFLLPVLSIHFKKEIISFFSKLHPWGPKISLASLKTKHRLLYSNSFSALHRLTIRASVTGCNLEPRKKKLIQSFSFPIKKRKTERKKTRKNKYEFEGEFCQNLKLPNLVRPHSCPQPVLLGASLPTFFKMQLHRPLKIQISSTYNYRALEPGSFN